MYGINFNGIDYKFATYKDAKEAVEACTEVLDLAMRNSTIEHREATQRASMGEGEYTESIDIVWSKDDVLSLDETLTDAQVSAVLEGVKKYHDATLGVSWCTLEHWIEIVRGETNEND